MMRFEVVPSLVLGLATAGCLGLGSGTPPVRSYVLTSVGVGWPAPPDPGKIGSIGLGPVTIPRFLDRPQIVTATAGNEVVFAELDRWAEPLADGIARVLAENLAIFLPGVRVERHPWPAYVAPQLEIRVDVLRFEGGNEGEAAIEVRWSLRHGKQEVASKVSRQQFVAVAPGYGGLVGSWSRGLANVAEEIAATIAQQRE
jgi:uncharacterized lipoprotein YmbA